MSKAEFDFGFSLVDEKELKQLEVELAKQNKNLSLTADEYKQRFDSLYGMILPLLRNLMKDPEKSYIHWPNRTERINAFIKEIEKLRQ